MLLVNHIFPDHWCSPDPRLSAELQVEKEEEEGGELRPLLPSHHSQTIRAKWSEEDLIALTVPKEGEGGKRSTCRMYDIDYGEVCIIIREKNKKCMA